MVDVTEFRSLTCLARTVALIASVTLASLSPTPVLAAPPDIVAQSAIVIDADSGTVLYQKNADESWAPASLTKIATALVALESAPLDQTLTVDQYDLVGEASMGLAPGDELTLETALYGLLLPSGNDAAMTIARNLGALPGDSPQESVDRFMRRTNLMLERMGLRHTRFLNPHGLDQPGHRTTARDLALLTRQALRNPTFRSIIGSPIYVDGQYALEQSNRLLGSYPGLIGGKTGITDGCGFCLMEAAERDGHTVIAVLLGSTAQAWYQDATLLLDYGFEQLASGTAGPAAAATTIAPLVGAGTPVTNVTATSVQPPVTAVTTPAVGTGSLAVQRTAPDVAVVRPASTDEPRDSSWRWPLSALLAMGAALALVTTYPTVLGLGSVLWQRRAQQASARRAHVRQRRRPVHPAEGRRAEPHRHQPAATGTVRNDARPALAPAGRRRQRPATGRPSLGTTQASAAASDSARVIRFDPAEAITTRAIRLARRGDYHAAESEFRHALRVDPAYDFTRCPGFWSMPPAGYVLAARAYRTVRRCRDARTLLTVVRLSFGSTPLLEAEIQALAAIAEPADQTLGGLIGPAGIRRTSR